MNNMRDILRDIRTKRSDRQRRVLKGVACHPSLPPYMRLGMSAEATQLVAKYWESIPAFKEWFLDMQAKQVRRSALLRPYVE
jgi:hypothetical protein